MADEARVTCGLSIRKTSDGVVIMDYRAGVSAFVADVSGAGGPYPGGVVIPTTGTDIDLTKLTAYGGFIHLENYDADNRFEWGIYDAEMNHYLPVGEVLPGEAYTWRLSRNFSEEFTQTGTGTSSGLRYLRCKAFGGTVRGFVGAFDP